MTTPNTSAVFTVWRTLTRLLQEASFPPSPGSPDPVAVWFGDIMLPPENVALSLERIVVAPAVEAPDEDWAPFGRHGRDEQFSVFIYVMSAIPGQTALEACDRLEALLAVVEIVLRDINATTPPIEFFQFQPWFVAPTAIKPFVSPDPNGAIGSAEVTVRCKFRVSIPPVV